MPICPLKSNNIQYTKYTARSKPPRSRENKSYRNREGATDLGPFEYEYTMDLTRALRVT